MKVLVVDVGGSSVKLKASGGAEVRAFESGETLGPEPLVHEVERLTADWVYDVVSIGYPGVLDARGPAAEPGNLGAGWVAFDFERAFGRPVRLVNDAVMQALGSYAGGRMLFLGFGTGLGSTLITERVIVPLELGCLLSTDRRTLVDRLGHEALERAGEDAWRRAVHEVVPSLKAAFAADYLVLGGGNAARIDPLPSGARRGSNDDAFAGGVRLWEEVVEPHDRRPSLTWRVVR